MMSRWAPTLGTLALTFWTAGCPDEAQPTSDIADTPGWPDADADDDVALDATPPDDTIATDVDTDASPGDTSPPDAAHDVEPMDVMDVDANDAGDDTTSPGCTPECENGGVCVAPGVCNCDATDFTGPTCATPCALACAVCKANALPATHEVGAPDADLRFIIDPDFASARASFTNASTPVAFSLTHQSLPVIAFIAAHPAESDAQDAIEHIASLSSRLDLQRKDQRVFTTWDGLQAVQTTFRTVSDIGLHAARARLVARVVGVAENEITGLPVIPPDESPEPLDVRLTVVFRGSAQVVTVATLVPGHEMARPDITAARGALHDTGALGRSSDRLESYCESFTIDDLPKLDVIFGIEDRARNASAREALVAMADGLFQTLGTSFVDARWTTHTSDGSDAGSGNSFANVCGMIRTPAGQNGSVWVPFSEDTRATFSCRMRDPAGTRACAAPADTGEPTPTHGLACSETAISFVQGGSNPAGVSSARDRQRSGATLVHVGWAVADDADIGVTRTFEDAVAEYRTFMAAPQRTVTLGAPFYPFVFIPFDGTAAAHEAVFIGAQSAGSNGGADISLANEIGTRLEDWLRSAATAASPYRTTQKAIGVAARLVVEPTDADAYEIVRGLVHGWSSDHATSGLMFHGNARPPAGSRLTVAYRAFVNP